MFENSPCLESFEYRLSSTLTSSRSNFRSNTLYISNFIEPVIIPLMKTNTLIFGLILFLLGMLGVFTVLTMDLPIPEEAAAILNERFSPFQIKLLLLINPTILLILAVLAGTLLHRKVGLEVPVIHDLVYNKSLHPAAKDIVKFGVVGGVISGILISGVSWVYESIIPDEFARLGEQVQPGILARFLYGGITEEILLRFGFMTLIVWILFKIVKRTPPAIYWIGIFISTLLFAVGHFPVVFQAVENPSALLLTYILIGNSLGGIVFGWLYWKKGLESAMIAHIFAHVMMLLAESLMNG